MNILFLALEPPFPPNDGGRLRTYNILAQLARRHAITLVTFSPPLHREGAHAPVGYAIQRSMDYKSIGSDNSAGNGGNVSELERLCRAVYTLPRPSRTPRSPLQRLRDLFRRDPIALTSLYTTEMEACLRRLVQTGDFQVVHIDQIYLSQYANAVRPLAMVLTHHNVEAQAQRRELEQRPDRGSLRWRLDWLEHRRWQRYEIQASRRANALAVVSAQDAAYFKTHAPKTPVFVAPNGVDLEYFQPSPRPTSPTLLFTGRMDYRPNVDAMLWFCAEVLPTVRQTMSEARLLIVGRDPTADIKALASLPGVEVTGTVPDVRPYYAQAAVSIVPLRLGGGTRLKIPEAMAMGMPIVTTTLGCEGLNVQDGHDLLIADDAPTFVQRILGLLSQPERASQLGRQARQTVEQRYGWEASAEVQSLAYQAAMTQHCHAERSEASRPL